MEPQGRQVRNQILDPDSVGYKMYTDFHLALIIKIFHEIIFTSLYTSQKTFNAFCSRYPVMKSPNYLLLLLLTVLLNVPLQAFSPYETYINSKKPKQVGLLARISPGNTRKIQDAIQKVTDGDQDCLLAANGVSNVTAFTRTI